MARAQRTDCCMYQRRFSKVPRDLLPQQRQLLPDDLVHFLLDELQVRVGHLVFFVEKIVVKPCKNKRSMSCRRQHRRPVKKDGEQIDGRLEQLAHCPITSELRMPKVAQMTRMRVIDRILRQSGLFRLFICMILNIFQPKENAKKDP